MLTLLSNAYECLGWRLLVLFALMLLAGIFEGLGLTMLFPLLSRFGVGESTQPSAIQTGIENLITYLGIPNELGPLLLVTVLVLYMQVGFQVAKSWMEADCQTRYTQHWHRRIFRSFIHAGWSFFMAEKIAMRVNAIIMEAGRTSAAFYMLVQMASCMVFILVYAAISLLSAWQMVLILAIFGSLIYVAVRPLSRRGQRIGECVSRVSENMQHRTMEFLHNAKLIKSTATETQAIEFFNSATDDYRQTYLQAGFHPKMVFGIYMLAGYTLLGTGLYFAIDSLELNPATVLVSVYIFLRLYVQMTNLQQFRQSYLLSAPALDSVLRQMHEAEAQVERLEGGEPLPTGPARLKFGEIDVHYGDTCVLQGLSFSVENGKVIGITGASGAGKSTLVDVVVGLVKPSAGQLWVDDIPLQNVSLADWRRSIGYMGQETLLLNGTIASNITWGQTCDQHTIEAAARAANAHDFIVRLPSGYRTEVGERGVRLSGGQRQRLGLARALLGSKRLLILDEATSALDSESEYQIMQALKAIKGEVTVLMIAHRLSTLADADEIFLLEHGKLIESGTWDTLIRQDGSFAKLLKLQQSSSNINDEQGAKS